MIPNSCSPQHLISTVHFHTSQTAEIQNLRSKFSDTESSLAKYVRIHDLQKFTESVAIALESSEYGECIAEVKWYKVEYTRGEGRQDTDKFEEL